LPSGDRDLGLCRTGQEDDDRVGQIALEVVDRLRTAPAHMELVYDEYGHFEGIITPMDVFEAIAGEFPDEDTDDPKVVTQADGSYLIAGWMPADEFADLLSIEIDADRDYETLAGLILDEVGHLPEVGQQLELQGWAVESLFWTGGGSTSRCLPAWAQ